MSSSVLMSCASCNADTVTLIVTTAFLYFYSSDENSDGTARKESSRKDRFFDIIFVRKGFRHSLREFNKTFALSGLTVLSLGLSLQAIAPAILRKTSFLFFTDEDFLRRLVDGGALLARLHAGYSSVAFYKRLAPSSPWFHSMWKGILAVSVLNLVSPYSFLEDPKYMPFETVINVVKWGRENYESSSLILLAAIVAHFVSMDTTVDRRRKIDKGDDDEKEVRTKMGGERDFEMNLRPFGYVALAAACVSACVVAFKGIVF